MTRLPIVLATIFTAVPAGPVRAQAPASRPSAAASTAEADFALAADAVRFLVGRQEAYDPTSEPRPARRRRATPDGRDGGDGADAKKSGAGASKATSRPATTPSEWPYEGVYRFEGDIPIGYRVGGTAITCLALLEAPGFEDDAPRRAAFDRGLAFCLEHAASHPLMTAGFLGTYDVRGWGHAYALALTLRTLERGAAPARAQALTELAKTLVKTLIATEIAETGGWNYSRPQGADRPNPASPFMTAPTLLALFQAEAQGFAVRRATIERALKTLEDARTDAGSFQYASNPKRKRAAGGDAVPGACARMAVAETTLWLAGRGDVGRVRGAVDAFFTHWDELEKRRAKTGTHEPPYGVAPYYFHFGHTYAAEAIEHLPEAERPALRARLRELYAKTRDADGTWNDRVFPRSAAYGTAMTTLGLLAPHRPRAASWK
ncbi:MAG TPA: hypothetical protein VEI02_04200 [Planctomycetota bacterium]|nr:hypothetical protein [Planctomycetota bacterium]